MGRLMSLSLAHVKVIRTVGHGELAVSWHVVSPVETEQRFPSENMVLLHLCQCEDVTHSEPIAAPTNAEL